MNAQVKAALKRAAIYAILAGGPVLIAAARDYAWPPEYGAYAAIIIRIIEGGFDSWRNSTGRVDTADVGQPAR